MKQIWVKADPWDKELVTTALEAGAHAVMVPEERVEEVRELGIITTVARNGDIRWEEDVTTVEVSSSQDEQEIVQLAQSKKVIVKTTDWNIIPLENLVAQSNNIFVPVKTPQEARTASEILEKGVAGVVVENQDPKIVKEIVGRLLSHNDPVKLVEFTIESVTPAIMGDRVCVDTCTLMEEGQGLLVGNSSSALFLVQSESLVNPYVSPRPFRVNAGAVHAYIMLPGGKTKYLSEIEAGDRVLGVSSDGQATEMLVGRVKIERRPLLLIKAAGPEGVVGIIVQNAETIRLVGAQGEAISVVALRPGDKVLGYVDQAGRHFGHKVDETITEK